MTACLRAPKNFFPILIKSPELCVTDVDDDDSNFAASNNHHYKKTMDFRLQDRMELKALVDFYATESDKNNQDCYVEIFRPDIKLDVYFGEKLGMQARDVHDMIRQVCEN